MKQTADSKPGEERQQQKRERELARRVAERVWEMWQEKLRHENERRWGGHR